MQATNIMNFDRSVLRECGKVSAQPFLGYDPYTSLTMPWNFACITRVT